MARARCSVVIGDDTDSVRARLRTLLEAMPGISRVGEAADAPGTIALIQSMRPSLVILDMMMPGGGGLAILSWLQQTRILCTTIVLTNHTLPAYRLRCERAGAQFFFDKSYDMDEFLSTVQLLTAMPMRQEPTT